MPLLSIIIPAYNAAGHIDRCLGSILNSLQQISQGMPVEVIVVNDGSSDDTAEIVNSYKNAFDGNLYLFNKLNNGVSSARNYGIKNAHGDYLYFMDADDEIDSSFFSVLTPKLKDAKSDVFIFGFTLVSNGGKKKYLPKRFQNLLNHYLEGKIRIAIWSVVCHKHFFKTISFDEGTFYGEDIEVISKILFNAKQTEVIEETLYIYYFDNPSSAMHKKISERNLTSVAAHKRVLDYMIVQKAPRNTIKAATNLALTVYFYWKERIAKIKDRQLDCAISSFSDVERLTPYFRFSKFYLYSLFYSIKYHIKSLLYKS